MISVELARQLQDSGVMWSPQAGDRFTIDERELLGQVFWVSDLTIEVHHYHDQTVLGFNGTTEWALDSVPLDVALWLPREEQLRELLGDRLLALRRSAGSWVVALRDGKGLAEVDHPDAECAYALALLRLT
jgi:hypothetical protein